MSRTRHRDADEVVDEIPGQRRVDEEAQEVLSAQVARRDFLKRGALLGGAAGLAGLLGGYGLRDAQGTPGAGASGTTITDEDIDAKRIAGVRIASEFITGTVPAGTDADPYPGSAIEAAIGDPPATGRMIFVPAGVWLLTTPITLPAGVSIFGVFPRKQVIEPTPPGSDSDIDGGTILKGDGIIDCFIGSQLQGISVRDMGFRSFRYVFNHGATNNLGMAMSRLQNLYFYDIDECIRLTNIQFVRMDHIIATNVNRVIHLIQDHSSWNGGNSVISDVFASIDSSVQGGILIESISGIQNLIELHRPQINLTPIDQFTGYAIWLKGVSANQVRWITISGGNFEGGGSVGLRMDQCSYCDIDLTIVTAATGVELQDTCNFNRISLAAHVGTGNHVIIGSASTDNLLIIRESWKVDSSSWNNFIFGGRKGTLTGGIYGLAIATHTKAATTRPKLLVGNTETELDSIYAIVEPGRKSGTAVIANGTSSIAVAHGLAATPTIAIATGRDLETDELRVSARDATNITLAVPANVTAARTVDWYAEV